MKAYLVLFSFLLSFSFNKLNAQSDSTYNLLWKIEKEEQKSASYLFGTMHVRDERAFNFSDSVMVSIEKCDQFAMEIHPDTMMAAVYKELLDPDTTNYYKDFLNEEEYKQFLKRFEKENGFSFDDLESKNPIAVKSIDEAENAYSNDRQTYVDMYLYGIAKTLGKSVYGLESTQNQLASMKKNMLFKAKFHFPIDTTYKRKLENELANVYQAGNLEDINKSIGENMLEDKIFIKRNKEMTESMIERMEESSVFAAIGAAHLIGENSVIAMLRKKGYKISKVPSSFTGVADKYSIDPTKMPWTQFKDDQAGAIVYFPSNSNNFSRNMAYPIDRETDSIRMNIWLYTDLTDLSNYLFTYNDFPLGYYFDSMERGFQEFEKDIKSKSKLLAPAKPILRDGVIGREYDVMLQNQYLTKIQVYVRGNRIYKFILQDLSKNRKELSDNRFLNSVHFLPYKKTQLNINKDTHPFLELPEFEAHRFDIDSINDYSSYLNNTVSLSTVNPNSGGCYISNSHEIDPFFRITDLDTFYNYFAEALQEWDDTLTHQAAVIIDGKKGQEIILESTYQRGFFRHQYWIDGNQLMMQSAYVDSTELWSQTANEFFRMAKGKKALPAIDLYSSKSKAILVGLKSTDTLVYKRAMGALNYYDFEKEDLQFLHQSFKEFYATDTLKNGPASNLLDCINALEDSTSIPFLSQLYPEQPANEETRVDLLSILIHLNGLEEFLELFLNAPPKGIDYTFNLLRPFQDSMELAYQHFDQLLSMMDMESYKHPVLNLSLQMVNSSEERYRNKVIDNYEKLTAFKDQDLESHKIKQAEANEKDEYYYPSLIYQYLRLFQTLAHESNAPFLHKLSSIDTASYMQAQVLLAKIVNQLDIEKEAVDSMLLTGYYTYDIMCAYGKSDQLSLLPDSLRGDSIYAKYKLIDYQDYADIYPDTLILSKEFIRNDSTILIYKTSQYPEEDEGEYLGMVGPFIKGITAKPQNLKAYYVWIEKEEKKDWKKAVEEAIPYFIKWGE